MMNVAMLLLLLLPAGASGAESKMFGDWITPDKSVVRMYQCAGSQVCGKLVHITAPVTTDNRNPNPQLRKRGLCNLNIAEGFKLTDATHAAEGRVYDPESGKTYRGIITLEGDALKLRGYVGIPMFGRTETWHRAQGQVATCS